MIGFCLFVLLQNISSAQEKTYATKEKRKQFYNLLVEKYASDDVKKIWLSDKQTSIFDQWVSGKKETELINDYATVIHELYHHNCVLTSNSEQRYIINKDIEIDVPLTEVYKSTELNKIVRKEQQDSIARYVMYVGGKNEFLGLKTNLINTNEENMIASVQYGIYGMLEEFAAYYYGANASLQLYDFFAKEKLWKEPYEAYDFKHLVTSDAIAYYEFRIFMANYLLYAQKKYPEIYKELYANKPLRVAYTLLTDKFTQLCEQITILTKNIPNEMQEELELFNIFDFSGSDEDMIRFFTKMNIEEDGIFEIKEEIQGDKKIKKIIVLDKEEFLELKIEYREYEKEMYKGIDMLELYFAMPDIQEKYLQQQLTNDLLMALENFKINGITEENYKQFLK